MSNNKISYKEYIQQIANYIGNKFLLFISFDIVNSTKLKFIKHTGYEEIFNILICIKELIENPMDNEYKKFLENFDLWKIIGDELIYIVLIDLTEKEEDLKKNGEQYLKTVKYILNKLKENDKEVKATLWGFDLKLKKQRDDFEDINQYFENSETKVFFKDFFYKSSDKDALSYFIKEENKYPNLKSSTISNIEFIGKHIDMGFRLSKFSKKFQILISFCIYKKFNIPKENIFVYNFVQLKGFHDNFPQPIIFWHDENNNKDFMEKNFQTFLNTEDDFINYLRDSENFSKRFSLLELLKNKYSEIC